MDRVGKKERYFVRYDEGGKNGDTNPPLPRNSSPTDDEIQYASEYYGVPLAKAKYFLAFPQFAPGEQFGPGQRAEDIAEKGPLIGDIHDAATALSTVPFLDKIIDIVSIPYAGVTGEDLYTGEERSAKGAAAQAAMFALLPGAVKKSAQFFIKQGAKSAYDVYSLLRPYLKNIDDAPADLKPLIQLEKKSSELRTHLRQYDVRNLDYGGKDLGGGFKTSGDLVDRYTFDAATDFLTETNPELVLKFSPAAFKSGMFDADLAKWADSYLTSYRGVSAENVGEAATFMRNPYGGGLQQKGPGTYSTNLLNIAKGYGDSGFVGAIRDMPSIGRSGQFGGDIVRDISNLEAFGGSRKGYVFPLKGIETTGETLRISRPETTMMSGILDVVPTSQADDLLRYPSDFGKIGMFAQKNIPRGMDAIMESLISTKEKGGKIKVTKKRKMKVLKK